MTYLLLVNFFKKLSCC